MIKPKVFPNENVQENTLKITFFDICRTKHFIQLMPFFSLENLSKCSGAVGWKKPFLDYFITRFK